jgi:hypothetical protein
MGRWSYRVSNILRDNKTVLDTSRPCTSSIPNGGGRTPSSLFYPTSWRTCIPTAVTSVPPHLSLDRSNVNFDQFPRYTDHCIFVVMLVEFEFLSRTLPRTYTSSQSFAARKLLAICLQVSELCSTSFVSSRSAFRIQDLRCATVYIVGSSGPPNDSIRSYHVQVRNISWSSRTLALPRLSLEDLGGIKPYLSLSVHLFAMAFEESWLPRRTSSTNIDANGYFFQVERSWFTAMTYVR